MWPTSLSKESVIDDFVIMKFHRLIADIHLYAFPLLRSIWSFKGLMCLLQVAHSHHNPSYSTDL